MKIFLDDSYCKDALSPFSLTKHVAEIRVGILTIREKWQILLAQQYEIILDTEEDRNFISIPANIIPTLENFEELISSAKTNSLFKEKNNNSIKVVEFPWQIFQLNDWALRKDFELITKGRISMPIDSTNQVINAKDIFIEHGAIVKMSIINAEKGPVYISKDAEIMEGCIIRGPFALGENAVVKMGARIYGATTVGPECIVGGEIKNSVFFNNSNKAHDGYLGDSVIGSWCNLGAGTSNSNVKNTGGLIKYQTDKNNFETAGNKAGLIMGDYSRCAINTSFNTGTIVGVCCNIFGNAITEKYISNFSWGKEPYDFDKAISHLSNWKKMKNQSITQLEIDTLKKINQKK